MSGAKNEKKRFEILISKPLFEKYKQQVETEGYATLSEPIRNFIIKFVKQGSERENKEKGEKVGS